MARRSATALQLAAAVTLLALVTPTLAQNPYATYTSGQNPYSTYNYNTYASATATATTSSSTATSTSSSNNRNGNPYASSSSSGNPNSSGSSYGGYGGASMDYNKMTVIRLAHGVLASAAFVFFFPLGAVIIRLVPSKYTVWIHAACQVFAYLLFTVAFGMGVWLAKQFEFGSFKLINEYHPIIGIVLFAVLILQPILGLLHHYAFKKHARRVVWSYAHIWLGRILVTVGIINGGLGLRLANNSKTGEIAYGVVAGIAWLIWVAAAVYGEIKRSRRLKAAELEKERVGSDETLAEQHGYGQGYQQGYGQGYGQFQGLNKEGDVQRYA